MTNRPKIIDGKALSQKIRSELKTKAAAFEASHNRKAGLAVILVGEDSASQIYVRNKITACEEVGIRSFAHYLPKETGKDDIIELIEALNSDNSVDGILVQLPLPDKSVENEILEHVSPFKDVDGFHAVNAGNLLLGNQCLAACTPSGVIELIKSTGTEISGKHAVVIGRSNIVGKPVAALLLEHNATVTVCHSKTVDLKEITRQADILVVAVGKKHFVTADMVKRGAVVIDVGMNRDESGLHGDVDFDGVKEVAGYITPVPGGVGPMTVAMLLLNTVDGAGA